MSLYSALSELNKVTENISTAEDPVEFNFAGINQVQMHEDIGLNFAAALRSFLRQDPDIIMIGEIRDFETAEIAVKAALTGHMVLSTLHTNDAPATINRLLNMGIEPFLVASAVNLITAQRLARRVCSECKETEDIPVQALIEAGVPADQANDFVCYRGKGCSVCSNTGYKGRVGFYQVMPMLEEIRELDPERCQHRRDQARVDAARDQDHAPVRSHQAEGGGHLFGRGVAGHGGRRLTNYCGACLLRCAVLAPSPNGICYVSVAVLRAPCIHASS